MTPKTLYTWLLILATAAVCRLWWPVRLYQVDDPLLKEPVLVRVNAWTGSVISRTLLTED